ncbi:OsmC family protein [uncultured Psychroserpens sp.]|uniref:OsmC family protein n=1 Tax=uncultured Psychroserpens sp. TaxID=255436 RepID=UPI002628066C|nr:OsmC family protein [uncultured Psychroserpens sp.]
MKYHNYKVSIEWTGNKGNGTSSYKSYSRAHIISVENKYESIKGSSDPSFLGDKTLYNPEELFLSSISTCHMLWYLHLCATQKIIVTEYLDNANGVMRETNSGSGKFESVMLNPKITINDERFVQKAINLHHDANKMCFIANSCNFKIEHNPQVVVKVKNNN